MLVMGLNRVHPDGKCTIRASVLCTQCGCYGHLPSDCGTVTHVQRPRSLEELIPADVRERWNITTTTRIVWNRTVTDEQIEREIPDNYAVDIRYRSGKLDSAVRDVMRKLKISTVHKMDGNLQKLRLWAVENGKKVRLIQETE
jgi:hypothetical protein